ncbi:hypothetical protein LINGRAHAP2_LOCUS16229 [Linum grandiflorum]
MDGKGKPKDKELPSRKRIRTKSSLGGQGTWKFNEAKMRTALTEMIIMDELPFTFVEHEGFQRFMAACPMFTIPSTSNVETRH